MLKIFSVTALIAISMLAWVDSRGYGLFDERGSSSSARSGSGRTYHK
jgi:hypothetical protein